MKTRNQTTFYVVVDCGGVLRLKDRIPYIKQAISEFDWGDSPQSNPYRNILISPILFKHQDKLDYMKSLKDEGMTEKYSFDSGGYQVLTGKRFKKPITAAELIDVNVELYNRLDWADSYTMVDHPSTLDDTIDEYKKKVDLTIEATFKLFDQLNNYAQERSVPVFHVRSFEDIKYQIDAYKPILEKSKKASFSAACLTYKTATRKIGTKELGLVNELNKRLPECDIHYLGSGSPLSAFMLNYIGIASSDSVSPEVEAGRGRVSFPYIIYRQCSDHYNGHKTNIDETLLLDLKEQTNHKCPFCVDIKNLRRGSASETTYSGKFYRMWHNICVLDDLRWRYENLDLSELVKFSTSTYKTLMAVTGDPRQLKLF